MFYLECDDTLFICRASRKYVSWIQMWCSDSVGVRSWVFQCHDNLHANSKEATWNSSLQSLRHGLRACKCFLLVSRWSLWSAPVKLHLWGKSRSMCVCLYRCTHLLVFKMRILNINENPLKLIWDHIFQSLLCFSLSNVKYLLYVSKEVECQ